LCRSQACDYEEFIGAKKHLVLGLFSQPLQRMFFAAFAVICWASLPAKAEVLTLSCYGIMKEQEQERPHTITNMGLIVNFDAGVVTGFTGITARIDEVNASSISFKGTTIHSSGTEWSVHGIIDRITGSLGSTVTWFNQKTNSLRMRMNYQLVCKSTN
jgi:hypothetical protein